MIGRDIQETHNGETAGNRRSLASRDGCLHQELGSPFGFSDI